MRLLQRDAEARAQPGLVGGPAAAEHLHVAGGGLVEPLEDLDGGGLAGAVGAEQAEALAAAHDEVEAVDGDDVAVALDEAVHFDGVLAHARRL